MLQLILPKSYAIPAMYISSVGASTLRHASEQARFKDWLCSGEAQRTEAAARHQGEPTCMSKKIGGPLWGRPGALRRGTAPKLPRVIRLGSTYEEKNCGSWGNFLINSRNFFPHGLRPTSMMGGSFGVVRLATARPKFPGLPRFAVPPPAGVCTLPHMSVCQEMCPHRLFSLFRVHRLLSHAVSAACAHKQPLTYAFHILTVLRNSATSSSQLVIFVSAQPSTCQQSRVGAK